MNIEKLIKEAQDEKEFCQKIIDVYSNSTKFSFKILCKILKFYIKIYDKGLVVLEEEKNKRISKV